MSSRSGNAVLRAASESSDWLVRVRALTDGMGKMVRTRPRAHGWDGQNCSYASARSRVVHLYTTCSKLEIRYLISFNFIKIFQVPENQVPD